VTGLPLDHITVHRTLIAAATGLSIAAPQSRGSSRDECLAESPDSGDLSVETSELIRHLATG
jgi:hypothetical protein